MVCGSIDLREGDIVAVNSAMKSWLYSDLLEKPSAKVLCRPSSYGGLGVFSLGSGKFDKMLYGNSFKYQFQTKSVSPVFVQIPCT